MSTGEPGAVTSAAVAAWADAGVRALRALRADLDRMNVFPVADSDTGSNMLHTFAAARDALREATPNGASQAMGVMARGAVEAARGNSGVILSQLLRGMSDGSKGREELDAPALAEALDCANRTATAAVVRPVEGTMLSVLRAAAEAAKAAPVKPAEVAASAADAAAKALTHTPEQLHVLAEAGVVDAGGRGLLAVLDELAAVLSEQQSTPRPEFRVAKRTLTRAATPTHEPPWEVMYLLDDVTDDAVATLRKELSALGESVTIAHDGAGTHAVHVHCGDIGAALEAGMEAGRPRQVRVESLAAAARSAGARSGSAVLAIVAGAELAELCQHEGVTVLGVRGGRPPSVRSIERAITDLAANHVTVLAGGKDLTSRAEQAAEQAMVHGGEVVVIPCASPVQVLAAIAVHDAERRTGDNVVAMTEAAAATRRGELKRADGDAITWIGRVSAGDIVGFIDDEVVLIAPAERSLASVATELLDLLLSSGGELVTVLVGIGAPAGMTEAVSEHVERVHPEIELTVYPGGQSESVLSLGVE